MSIVYVEGFETYTEEVAFDADAVKDHLGCLTPPQSEDWFTDTGEVTVDDTDSRITGHRSLKFARSSKTDAEWEDANGAVLGWGFTSQSRVTIGFGLKYDTVPDEPIPLLVWRYDATVEAEEQTSLWISPNGSLFFSSVPYNNIYTAQSSPVPVAVATTAAGVFRFEAWQYIEVFLDFSGATPTVSVNINNTPVMEQVESDDLQQMDAAYITSVHIVNPTNNPWGNAAFNQWIDDIYITINQDGFLGPQQIILLDLDANLQNEWDAGGSMGTGTYDPGASAADGITASANGDTDIWSIDDLPVGVGNITAICMTVVAETGFDGSMQLMDTVEMGWHLSSGDTTKVSQEFTISGGDQTLRLVSENTPGETDITATNVNSLCAFVTAQGTI